MIALIITPYTGDGLSPETGYHPLLLDVIQIGGFSDITGNPLASGIPSVNLLVIEADVTGAQLSTIKADDRFFVLEPGPGYNGNALENWLAGKGASAAGVIQGDTGEVARDKVIGYLRGV